MTYTVGVRRVLGTTIDRARFVVRASDEADARAIVRRYLRARSVRGFSIVDCVEGADPAAFEVSK